MHVSKLRRLAYFLFLIWLVSIDFFTKLAPKSKKLACSKNLDAERPQWLAIWLARSDVTMKK